MDFSRSGQEFSVLFDRWDSPRVREAAQRAARILCVNEQSMKIEEDKVTVILAQGVTSGSAIELIMRSVVPPSEAVIGLSSL